MIFRIFTNKAPNTESKQYKPNPKLNFFQNYTSHLRYLEDKLIQLIEDLKTEPLEKLPDVMADHFHTFENLRDGHDYMDEILGTTVFPALATIAAVVYALYAAIEGAHALAIRTGLKENDEKSHGEEATQALLLAIIAFASASLIRLISFSSLIFRPCITLAKGWKPQDLNRFIETSSTQNNL